MSIAGVHSNRGDSYQTLIALEWALRVLFDPQFQWIEVDSIAYPVDDVVVGRVDGTHICCQCKKNQPRSKVWTIADLKDELKKASKLLANDNEAVVHFYSRSPFGVLSQLQENSAMSPDESSYRANLGKEQREADAELFASTPYLSTYDFIRRTEFVVKGELEQMIASLQERLRYTVSNPTVAFDALWRRFDQLGARMGENDVSTSVRHRLTKEDLTSLLQQAGAILAPPMELAEIRASFADTSAIGRSWRQDIAGQRIHNPVLNDLLNAIDQRKRSILLTGLPGSGKTCVVLALQTELEERARTRADIEPLFIQSREFADLPTARDREAQGLHEKWVERIARLADAMQAVVVIDSLDVLPMAREYSVLTYFLAQIDRLLMIPNVTVVTACRDFDRQYDRRIAEREWDCELSCSLFDWESDIVPLLGELDIDISTIDTDTRELIRNPRELSLFVELARKGGSFNVVTSQALGQRYIDSFVRDDTTLGEAAVQAIEIIADEMLKTRRLSVPKQRFTARQNVLYSLQSLNVLQETEGGELMFGHQTLLDILVISGAIRSGVTLREFIQGLPPVPFVRPSIRSFVAQLATRESHEFRKQIRAVLTGDIAFHIRRLVAESLAEQKPQDEDWSLIRDLWNRHRDVFQVIYAQGQRIEWHHFWLKYLVPFLKDNSDLKGLTAHTYRVSQWKNDDPNGVLAFWTEMLHLVGTDTYKEQIVRQLDHHLSEIDEEHLEIAVPLLGQLLSMPRPEHSLLGHAVARYVKAGVVDDTWLWQFIAGDVPEDNAREYHLNQKLRCQPHEFGNSNDDFFFQRMLQSTKLLDLALDSVEKWSHIQSSVYENGHRDYRSNFLFLTSYDRIHSHCDEYYIDSSNILFDAMEAAIVKQARTHSNWWQDNRERLALSDEGALRYFAVRACTDNPELNIELISCVLTNKDMLESDLFYELGTLIKTSFIYLPRPIQSEVTRHILTLHTDDLAEDSYRSWIVRKRVELIVTIPNHLRSPETQALLEDYEKTHGTIIRQPDIRTSGGWVRPPFSFEVFHRVNDDGVMTLLTHYDGHKRDIDDILMGIDGEEGVGWQLREASSRHPTRFLYLLSNRWSEISNRFRNGIMDGAAKYLAHRYGKLQISDNWEPLEEPDAQTFAYQVITELERHPNHWRTNHSASDAIKACSHVIRDTESSARLVFLTLGFAHLREERSFKEGSSDPVTTGINMTTGRIAEALMILANGLLEQDVTFPELLSPTLRRFAGHEHPAIRALILQHLPYLQYRAPELGWDLFHIAMQDATGLWQTAESCLYYAYSEHFEKVRPVLERMQREGSDMAMKTWGRVSALAALRKHIDISVLISDLETLESTPAWQGAASVWTHPENFKQHREHCLTGISRGLKIEVPHATAVVEKMNRLFDKENVTSIPTELIRVCFELLEKNTGNQRQPLFGFDTWLNATSYRDPEKALSAAEIYFSHAKRTGAYLTDYKNNLTQLITRLFAEAEEREESDRGEMLQRVVALQDTLLSLGVPGIADWLKAAERP